MNFEPWQWVLLLAGAFFVGLSKTGITGLSIMFVAVFANLMPARQATGLVLPLLIVGDLCAVGLYRRHTQWSHLWKLFPWTIGGVLLGWGALQALNDGQTKRLVGLVLALMLAVHLWRQWKAGREAQMVAVAPWWFAALTGLMAGFATQVSNAAGPVMMLYLLAMRLPKLEFLGTGAVFFLLLNWFKVPFMVQLGLINAVSLSLNLKLAPAVLLGATIGRLVAGSINQRVFERVALILTAIATLRLLV